MVHSIAQETSNEYSYAEAGSSEYAYVEAGAAMGANDQTNPYDVVNNIMQITVWIADIQKQYESR